MSKIIRNTLILTIITVVAGLGLGLVYEVTKEPIARTEEQAKKEAWQAVFSDFHGTKKQGCHSRQTLFFCVSFSVKFFVSFILQ